MFYNSLTMSGIFFIISFIFLIFRDKACFLIAGYNCIPKDQRKNYDEKKLSKDFGTTFFKYGLIWLFGAVGCILISNWSYLIAFIIWIIYFSKNTSFSNKIFDKYKIN
ncbi:DUF3784 domain-containing protein [Romboutsia sp. 1001216sp1]|uniref:DUF3784 domain-containing protein n=1 Tax=unclassified Romboutsia TaxID=2626894 RepID=UPI00189EFCE5|nr:MULTISPECIES: DUF3784 domain-containing protein [unclassified Romboutsia]MDB8791365.1 DUF3784 domain-containing protein [Romboutsia sp. 1001216sp1]MDB8794795.1 DUF3784 domain-containing protein [Romboutsia sp. 1001216sp1]MDB8797681.1 DUF3784 domain-containing protein [Romboutsia sp. 1001216sp1]MDB8800481.1 DUF3784 domain-containing protein [Romboutsia sp. 1001216sp1]MDB8803326.1 DUF3784 domain-containing protein [Romboutsia sp. 1001216sp1]